MTNPKIKLSQKQANIEYSIKKTTGFMCVYKNMV